VTRPAEGRRESGGPEWACRLCGFRYRKEEAARECEAQGLPVIPPVGTIIMDSRYLQDTELLTVVARVPSATDRDRMGFWHAIELVAWNWRDRLLYPAGASKAAVASPAGDTSPRSQRVCLGLEKAGPLKRNRSGCAYLSNTVLVDARTRRYHRCWRDMAALGLPLYYWRDNKAVPASPPIFNPEFMTELEALSYLSEEQT
jgi:hypothetical protein